MKRSLTLASATAGALLLTPMTALAHDDTPDTDLEPDLILYAEEESFTAISATGEELDEEEDEFDPQVGDKFYVVDALHSTEERDDWVGRNYIDCTVAEVEGSFPSEEEFEELEPGDDIPEFRLAQLCSGTVTLYGQGDLTWQGLETFTDEDLEAELSDPDFDPTAEPFITVAITGGTWDFIGASGQVSVFDEMNPDEDGPGWSRYEVVLL